jgi:Bacterial Ig-like domain (group 2)
MNEGALSFRSLGLFGLMVMASCSSGTPTLTLNSVSITSSAALKLGTPTTLSASALSRDVQSIAGKSLRWTSSDPSVAVIDPVSGVVTAKRLGSTNIEASSDGVIGKHAFKTYGLEVSGGTRVGRGLVGTTILVRARAANLQEIATVNVNISGPGGWNSDSALEANATGCQNPLGISQAFVVNSRITPISGTYNATATLNGEAVSATFNIDATKTLAPLTISNALQVPSKTDNTKFAVASKWGAVPGAVSYYVRILSGTSFAGETYTSSLETSGNGAPVLETTLKPDSMQVFGFTADMTKFCAESFVMPTQTNSSVENSLIQ